jgi:hypothetical protein
MMSEVSIELLMREVRSFAPDAILTEESDGNVSIVLNMKYDMGVLRSFDYAEVDDVE